MNFRNIFKQNYSEPSGSFFFVCVWDPEIQDIYCIHYNYRQLIQHYKSHSHTNLSMCATTPGPYQSPALFPEVIPRRTSRWTPSWADRLSPNQDTIVRWYTSFRWASASSAPHWGWHEGSGTLSRSPWNEASIEATSFRAVLLVHVSVSRGSKVSASGQVQSGKKKKKEMDQKLIN